jgi:tetratricopeptide (TPR) repeat protein
MFALTRVLITISLVSVYAVVAAAQDLGSANRLFGSPKKPAAKQAPARAAAEKPRKTAVKRDRRSERPTTATSKEKPAPVKKEARVTTPAKKRTPARETSGGKKPPSKPSSRAEARRDSKPDSKSAAQKPADSKNPPRSTATKAEPKRDEQKTDERRSRPEATGRAAEELYENLIQSGNIARDDRRYGAAEGHYKRAAALGLKDPRAVYGLGNLYADQQRWEEAEAAYRKALDIDPNEPFTLVALSYVLSQPIAAPNLSERYEESEKLARRAIQLNPTYAVAHDQLGTALELRGLIGSETESAYRRAIQLDPSFAPAYAHLGRLLRRRGSNRDAAGMYEEALRRSTDISTKILVADVLQSEQRFSESESLLREALKHDPRNPSGLFLLGRALTAQQKFSEAEAVLRISLDVSPNGYMPSSLLGSLYARQGRFSQAEGALLQAAKFVSPSEKRQLAQQFESLGDGYMKAGQARDAARVYQYAKTLDAARESLGGKLARAQRGS